MTKVLSVVVIGAMALLAGCSSSTAPVARPTPTRSVPATLPAPVANVGSSARLRLCRPTRLRLLQRPYGGAGGTNFSVVRVESRSSIACAISGFSLMYFNGHGGEIGRSDDPRSISRNPKMHRVTIAADAYRDLRLGTSNPDDFGLVGCDQMVAKREVIGLDGASFLFDINLQVCSTKAGPPSLDLISGKHRGHFDARPAKEFVPSHTDSASAASSAAQR